MDWKLAATIGIPSALVVLGWFLAHWLTSRRELAGKRREARLRSLEAAYMRLATSNQRTLTKDTVEKLETFVSELQLYGTPRQFELMKGLVEAFKRGDPEVSFDELLVDLRDAIRAELQLEPLSGPVWWLKLTPEPDATKAQPQRLTNANPPPGRRDA